MYEHAKMGLLHVALHYLLIPISLTKSNAYASISNIIGSICIQKEKFLLITNLSAQINILLCLSLIYPLCKGLFIIFILNKILLIHSNAYHLPEMQSPLCMFN